MDWLDLLAVQGTLKSLHQHHSLKTSILQRSAFFIVQLSHPYMTTGKTIAFTRRIFVGKVMSLLSNMLSRSVITFSQGVSFNFMAAVTICSDFGAPPPTKNKVFHCFHCFRICLPWSDGKLRCHDLSFLNVEFYANFFTLLFHFFIKSLLNSALLSAMMLVSSAYLRLLIFFLAILIPACASSSPAFLMMYSA